MNNSIFITVRTASTRLPQKAILEINNKPTIVYLIERLKKSKKADSVVLCTTHLKEDDILCDIAKQNNIFYYRGSAKDKLERWLGAAKKYSTSFFVTADGDDLFCEPELIDMAFSQFGQSQPDFIEAKGLISGCFTYGIKTEALQKVCEIKGTNDTEMMWVYFTDTGLFKVEELKNVLLIYKRPEIRMTLDYEDDFKFFETVINHFISINKENFTLRDIVEFLDKNPEVIKINQYLQEKFLQNQKSKTKLILKNVR